MDRHPSAARKIGCGVQAIRIELNTHWKPCPMFVIVRQDGTTTDFSYRRCLETPSPVKYFLEGCRAAVVEDILRFKRQAFEAACDGRRCVVCPLTGETVGWHAAHVDHAPPWTFRRIVDAFVTEIELDVAAVPYVGDGDGDLERELADPTLRETFRQFHNERAMLRLLSQRGNLSHAHRREVAARP